MKMRILFLVGFIAGAWGCGGDAVTNPPPPVTPAPPTVTPQHGPPPPQPTVTPSCQIRKICEDSAVR